MSMRWYPCLRAGFAACWLLVASAPGVALAQDEPSKPTSKAERKAARDAYDKGTQAFDKGDYAKALDSFVKANALIPSIQAMYWIARAQDKLGNSAAAIEAYEGLTARHDFASLTDDKKATVRERLTELKAAAAPPRAPVTTPEPEPAPTPPPVEPPAPVVEPEPVPPPLTTPPPASDEDDDVLPRRNTAELGVMGGVLFVSPAHNLVEGERAQQEFEIPVWQVGLRAAFFPEKVFGIEAEWAHGFGEAEDGEQAQFDAVRGHLVGQLPSSRFVPFALVGAGVLRASHSVDDRGLPSSAMGSDTDFLLEAGIGFKVMATKVLVPRLDLRLGMTQAEGGGFADGIALHPEVLLGISFAFGG